MRGQQAVCRHFHCDSTVAHTLGEDVRHAVPGLKRLEHVKGSVLIQKEKESLEKSDYFLFFSFMGYEF